jgi:hypothetical protein
MRYSSALSSWGAADARVTAAALCCAMAGSAASSPERCSCPQTASSSCCSDMPLPALPRALDAARMLCSSLVHASSSTHSMTMHLWRSCRCSCRSSDRAATMPPSRRTACAGGMGTHRPAPLHASSQQAYQSLCFPALACARAPLSQAAVAPMRQSQQRERRCPAALRC